MDRARWLVDDQAHEVESLLMVRYAEPVALSARLPLTALGVTPSADASSFAATV